MTKYIYQLETLGCPSCIKKIEGVLKKTKGVGSYEVLFNSSRVKLDIDEGLVASSAVKAAIEAIGYPVLSEKVVGA